MKKLKKVAALMTVAIMVMATCISVFAQEVTKVPVGADGATITVENPSKGETYEVYKVFAATVSDDGIAYSGLTTSNDYFEVDSAGNVTATAAAVSDGKLTDEAVAWIKANGTKVAEAVADGSGTLVFKGLDYGYYYVSSSLGTTVTITSTQPDATIVDKNTTDPTDLTKAAEDDTRTVGENENYTLTFTATNYAADNTKITSYTVEDTSDDLKVDTASVKVSVMDAGAADYSEITVPAANITYTNKTLAVKVDWVDGSGNHIYKNGASVRITYTAEVLTSGAVENSAVSKYNTVQFDTATDTVNNYKFELVKDNGDKKVLTGAEFSLYKTEDGTDAVELVKTDKGYRVANSDDADTTTVIEVGNAVIEGLGNGTYYVQEDKAPAGYNKLTQRVSVTVNGADNTATIENGVYSEGGLEVINNAGSTLPSTGGIGTTIFYTVGGILVVGAGVLLFAKRRTAK